MNHKAGLYLPLNTMAMAVVFLCLYVRWIAVTPDPISSTLPSYKLLSISPPRLRENTGVWSDFSEIRNKPSFQTGVTVVTFSIYTIEPQ